MKKPLSILACFFAVITLGGCDLFIDSVEYHVTGPSSSISILYMDKGGGINEVAAASPWQESFSLFTSDRPAMTFLKVTNNAESGDPIIIYISVNGTQERTATVAAGTSGEIYYLVE